MFVYGTLWFGERKKNLLGYRLFQFSICFSQTRNYRIFFGKIATIDYTIKLISVHNPCNQRFLIISHECSENCYFELGPCGVSLMAFFALCFFFHNRTLRNTLKIPLQAQQTAHRLFTK